MRFSTLKVFLFSHQPFGLLARKSEKCILKSFFQFTLALGMREAKKFNFHSWIYWTAKLFCVVLVSVCITRLWFFCEWKLWAGFVQKKRARYSSSEWIANGIFSSLWNAQQIKRSDRRVLICENQSLPFPDLFWIC